MNYNASELQNNTEVSFRQLRRPTEQILSNNQKRGGAIGSHQKHDVRDLGSRQFVGGE